MAVQRRLTPFLLLAALVLGTGLGIGLGLSEAPTGSPSVTRVIARTSVQPSKPRGTATASEGPTVEVPMVTGLTRADAESTIAAAGLRCILGAEPSTVPAGVVVAETPAPGSMVAKGSVVILALSIGSS